MFTLNRVRAFSLIEVVFAIGLTAGTLVVIIGLLGRQGRQSNDATDLVVASQLADGVRVELVRLARHQGFDGFAAGIPVMSHAVDEGLLLVADRHGMFLQPLTTGAPVDGMGYFLVEIRRFPDGQLAYEPVGAVLPINARISWPYQPGPSGVIIAAADRSSFSFNLALNR